MLEKISGPRERYRALDPHAGPEGEMRAIHVFPASNETEQRIRVLQRLNNRNLPAILEYHRREGMIYVVVPWIRGRTLRQYLDSPEARRHGDPSALESFRLFYGLAHGLSQLHHHRNIVHGDLKPENLVVQREPSHLVMIDFGSAWVVERTMMRTTGDGVDPTYSAPEQQREEPFVDFRSDQFSASVVFYEMLTRKVPYDSIGGQAGLDANRRVYEKTLVRPSKIRRDRSALPSAAWARIDDVVCTGLRLDAEDRFPNRSSWLDALEDIRFEINRESKTRGVGRLVLGAIDWVSGFLSPRH